MPRGIKRSEAEEALFVQRLGHRLLLVESLEAHQGGKHFDLASPDSELAGDDSLMGYLQTSHLVGHCLSVSLDALRTVRLILQDPDVERGIRLPMIGQYSVIRTSVEAAALAVWLLSPDERTERIKRSLQARWDDIIHDNKLVLVFTEGIPTDTKADLSLKQRQRRENAAKVSRDKNKLRQLAKTVGIPEEDFNRGLDGFGPIIAEASQEIGIKSTHARGAWHLVSGLTHPSASRGLTASNVEFTADASADVGHALLTADTGLVNMALESAYLMHIAALRLAAKRGENPAVMWVPGPEIPLPPVTSRGVVEFLNTVRVSSLIMPQRVLGWVSPPRSAWC